MVGFELHLKVDLVRVSGEFLLAWLTGSSRGSKCGMGRVDEVVGSGWLAGLAGGGL